MGRQLVFAYVALSCVVSGSPIDSQPSTIASAPAPDSTVKATLIRNPKNFEVLDGVLIGVGVLLLLAITFVAWKFSWFGCCRKKSAPVEVTLEETSTMPGKPKAMATTPYSLPVSVIHAMNGVAEAQKVQKGNVFNYTK
ncbi:hypothetical protein K493DRAFT_300327 [Basidiobolus meristosporus CBS 931.73]|uniref:Uncharacterized protein n=1 Tax=Basidiobolus meristosporus CBS 931.73 TaxID=1314790 RepID=A0A1Y1YHZ4_9FUNG|nr:hypothetical protein K493DRAFT_300327 [Basidiobolus meristosporus CBS 931.73]|eukprot:ORX97660.1 hypothetical protein K493DRAFT_300327 [Basidiobolus meristosporus CBS 931.73]